MRKNVSLGVGGALLVTALVVLSVMVFDARSSIRSLRDDLAGVEADLAAVEEAKAGVEANLAAVEEAKAGVEANLAAVEEAKAGVEADLAAVEEAKADVEADLAAVEEAKAGVEADLAAAEKARATATARAAATAAELRDLQQEVGQLESLRTEIQRLEQERRALIPDIRTQNVPCTGSMEPVITCLDTVDMLRDVDLDDVVIGAVVAVTLADGDSVLHRVVDIKDGKVLTRGDNTEKDDGWVPLENVYKYVVRIGKDVNMGNASLRERVNSAQTRYRTTKAEYHRLATRYCGGLDRVNPCRTSASNFRKVYAAWDENQTAWCRYTWILDLARLQYSNPVAFEAELVPVKLQCAGRYEG